MSILRQVGPLHRPCMPCCLHFPERKKRVLSANRIYKHFTSPDLDPPYRQLPRDSSPPLLAVGSQVEQTTISRRRARQSGRGAGAGRDELGHQRRRFISWRCDAPEHLTGRTCLCQAAHLEGLIARHPVKVATAPSPSLCAKLKEAASSPVIP